MFAHSLNTVEDILGPADTIVGLDVDNRVSFNNGVSHHVPGNMNTADYFTVRALECFKCFEDLMDCSSAPLLNCDF